MSTTSQNDTLSFPNFGDIKVSTKTYIAKTNLTLDLEKLFNHLPITEWIVVPKKRGRKKKNEVVNPNKDIVPGSIITLKYRDNIRGVDLNSKKNATKKRGKWFRNSFTVVLAVSNKNINFKVSQNGMFQITGCKFDSHAEECIKYIWDYIKDTDDIFTFQRGEMFETYYIPAMRNIDFDLGFLVDREKLAQYMNRQDQFHSLLETSFGYTGVNIKIPINDNIVDLKIKRVTYNSKKNNPWVEHEATYGEYLDLLPIKEKEKKLKKDRYNTFLVFHSGKVIMSGMTAGFMKKAYIYFLQIMRTCYEDIREKLDEGWSESFDEVSDLSDLSEVEVEVS